MADNLDNIKVTDFACSCQAEERAKLDALVKSVAEELNCSEEGLVEEVINTLRSFSVDGSIESIQIDGIPFDQWGAIDAHTEWHEPRITFRIQFDDLRHGFALLYRRVREQFPPETLPE